MVECHSDETSPLRFNNYRLWHKKKRACDNRMPHLEIQRLQPCEKLHAIHQVGLWWCAMIILLRTPFLLQWDVQTIIKLKLEQVSKEYQKEFLSKKNMRKASQNVFYIHIAISQSLWGFKVFKVWAFLN